MAVVGHHSYEKELVSELVYFLASEQVPGGGGGQSQVTIPFFRRELAVCAFWSNSILCRLDNSSTAG